MLAYVFWHAAPKDIPVATYEAKILAFGKALTSARVSGVEGVASYATTQTPWLGEAGYEDWTWLEGAWALDLLNEKAVSGEMEAAHRDVAQITKHGGYGALYYQVGGTHAPLEDSKVVWLTRRRGIEWRPALGEILRTANVAATAWRRQMVLGPWGSTEFAIIGTPELSLRLPEGWSFITTSRRRIKAK